MSWRSGAKLFEEIWPLIQARIADPASRQEFLGRLLALFLEWDVDPDTVADLHPEVRQALSALGALVEAESTTEEDVGRCAQYLRSPEEKIRVTTAQAIESYVHQAENPAQAAAIAIRALVGALRDSSRKVRRAAAKSLESLLADDFGLPGMGVREGLEAALSDDDELVRKRIAKAMKRLGA